MSSEEVDYSIYGLPNEISGTCYLDRNDIPSPAIDVLTFEDVIGHVELMSKKFRTNLLITITNVEHGSDISWGPYPTKGE